MAKCDNRLKFFIEKEHQRISKSEPQDLCLSVVQANAVKCPGPRAPDTLQLCRSISSKRGKVFRAQGPGHFKDFPQ